MKSYHQYPFDMYVSLPGGAFEFHWKPAQKPSAGTLTVSVTITLEECYSSVDKEVNITRQRICPVCHGTGAHSHEHSKPCSVCEGHGWHLYLAEKSEGYKHVVNKTCEYCHVSRDCAVCRFFVPECVGIPFPPRTGHRQPARVAVRALWRQACRTSHRHSEREREAWHAVGHVY